MEEHCAPFPTVKVVEKKLADLQKAKTFRYDRAAVQKRIDEKNKFRKRPVNFTAEKTQLEREKALLLHKGDYDGAERVRRKIEELTKDAEELDRVCGAACVSFSGRARQHGSVLFVFCVGGCVVSVPVAVTYYVLSLCVGGEFWTVLVCVCTCVFSLSVGLSVSVSLSVCLSLYLFVCISI